MALTSMGLNPKQTQTILNRKFGYTGSTQTDEMEAFMQSKPEAESVIVKLAKAAKKIKKMNQGGIVPRETNIANQPHRLAYINPEEEMMLKAQGGSGMPGPGGIPAYETTTTNEEEDQTATTVPASDPTAVYSGTVATPNLAYLTPLADQDIAKVPEQDASKVATAYTVGQAQQAGAPVTPTVATMTPETVTGQVKAETAATQAAQGVVSPEAQVTAQQQLTTSVSGMEAAQGTATMVNAPPAREIQQGELITGAADAEKAALFTEQIDAATATPSKQATVAGQLEGLMAQFEGGNTPAWAAGSMRTAMQTLAARGLGASSLAGQAVIQAAMESAIPIAQADASVIAQFEAQNLSNRQQRAMLAAQQRATFLGQEFDQAFQARVQNATRIADVANMNFTAEQQIAIEDSRAANTMNMANLNNQQAMVMAEAAALSQLDMANLNNRQQAAVQNAQNFLQMDMQNLSNEQQTSLFRAQQNVQALFTDQAAENAALQFNAASENQTNQFFADLQANVAKFNADQANSVAQFDANAVNATYQFNVAQDNAFRQFMINQNLAVAQANAQWRQQIATTNQAAQNEAAFYAAKEMNALSQAALDEIWQKERDEIDYVYNAFQNDQDRANAIILQKLAADAELDAAKLQAEIGATKEVSKAVYDWMFE
jgi:hypothetical protein